MISYWIDTWEIQWRERKKFVLGGLRVFLLCIGLIMNFGVLIKKILLLCCQVLLLFYICVLIHVFGSIFLRISITFRRMDENRRPADYAPEPDLLGIQPLPYDLDKTNNNSNSLKSDQRQSRRRSNRRGSSNIDARASGGRSEPYSEPSYSSQGRGLFRRPG